MPELPEVETVVRVQGPRMRGRTITRVEFRWPRQAQPSVAEVATGLEGATIVAVRRRAKFIVAELRRDGRAAGWMLIHLRMSGRLTWADEPMHAPSDEPASKPAGESTDESTDESTVEPSHTRVLFEFSDGARLCFCDARKFGRVFFLHDLETIESTCGVEPLERAFTAARLAALLMERRQRLKPFLLDQRRVAGLGNIYADEALFRAGLHPLRTTDSLRVAEIDALHASIRSVLREAIRNNGTSFDWIYPEGRMQEFLRVYGRGGKPCRVCGREIRAIRVGQRGTHFCPGCQPPPRAARRRTTRRTGA